MNARRVRRVRLAAPSDPLVRRGALLLEDALHTATLPGAEGGRVLLVRSLDVGRIDPAAPPSSLALAVEARMRELARDAVWAGDPAAPRAPAVWFRDAVEAAGLLAVRLIREGRADAWFWRAAIPEFRAEGGVAGGVRMAIAAAAESAPGAAAVAGMLRIAMENAAADTLLACLDADDARRLMAHFGWAADASASIQLADVAPAEWRPLLARWIARWGADDPRSVWLAATVLVDAQPTRAADPRLPAHAARLIASLHPPDPPPPLAVELPAATPIPPVSNPPRAAESHPPAPTLRPPRWLDDAAPRPASTESADPPSIEEPHRSAEVVVKVVGGAHPPIDPPADGPIAADHHQPIAIAEDAPARMAEREAGAERAPSVIGREGARPAIRYASDGAERSEGAGLYFLVAAMEHLGMRRFLADAPALLEAELPARVLLRIAARTGVPADDPAVAALAAARDAGEAGARYPFAAPQEWAGVLRPGPSVPRDAATFDASGRLLVAAEDAGIDLVVDAWVTALRRFCRRRVRMGLHALMRRPGRIAFTRTHVDMSLPLDGADVRIRMAGLDLDPGWVPWLGRVVAFHYVD
ncbi:hypothetical protein [Longimicrobium sp.]|uniref:hypothetical protein n=1 Tax=Longimicrobium sp. TaxID=2029185 RepID=UPI002E309767|nr:hypothetical protein [Longimicrobium sp.]HEX6042053.1 hypothetical protein [Longimicrobium sp.]